MTGTHYNAAGGQRSPMGGQANFYISRNFSLRTSTGILTVYEPFGRFGCLFVACVRSYFHGL